MDATAIVRGCARERALPQGQIFLMKKRSVFFFRSIVTGLVLLLTIPLQAPLCAGEKAPYFWMSNLDGTRFKSKNRENPIIISFFFIDCVPCRIEIPKLYALIRDQYPDINLLFMDPLREDSESDIRNFSKAVGVPSSCFYHDPLGMIAKKFRIAGKFPTIIGIRDKEIVFRLHDLSEESLEKIDQLAH